MDYKIIAKKDIPKRNREDWAGLLSKLAPMNAISITCSDQRILRLNQFCLYRAAKKTGINISTFKNISDGKLTLTVWLSNLTNTTPV